MALLLSSAPPFLASPSRKCSSATLPPTPLLTKPVLGGVRFPIPILYSKLLQNGAVVALRASSSDNSPSDNKEEQATSDEMKEVAAAEKKLPPLESKLEQMAEQKMRMKMAKKIRLRRKRLVRKRRLRKKGRWPPSKMNKLKNV